MTTTVSKQQLDDGVMHVVSREFGLPHHRLASALVRVTQRSASRITVSTTVRGLRHFPSPTSDVETVVAIAEEWLEAFPEHPAGRYELDMEVMERWASLKRLLAKPKGAAA